MNPARLLEHFDRIAEAPGAVQRLRRFILDLAVRGKLVEQDPSEESPVSLLATIRKKNEKQVQAGLQKQEPQRSQVSAEEKWFTIPPSWLWARLGQVTHVLMGQSPPGETYNQSGEGVPLINGPVEFSAGPFGNTVVNQYTTAPTNFCEQGDLLICVRGSTTGRTNIAGFRACIGRGVAAIRPYFRDDYIRLCVWRLRESIIAMGRGIAFPSVSRQQLEELPIPLPPLAEQLRIVAKVNELMALCDRLEASQAKRESRRDRLSAASLKRIGQPEDEGNGEEFQENVRFNLHHLPRLTTRPEHIKQLRKTILNLAVRGKLVPQDPEDEPASELLKRVHTERALLWKAGNLKKDRLPGQPGQHGWPFDIPDGWNWAVLQQIITFGPQNGISPKPSTSDDAPKAITLTATTSGKFDPRHYKKVEINVANDSEFWLKPGDFLFQRGNTREYVGMAAYYDGEPGKFLYPDLIMKVRLSKSVSIKYIHLCSISAYAREYFSAVASGAQETMPKINQSTLVSLPIPVPSLSEQGRIVAKVEELLAICDQLESQLTACLADSSRLLEASLREALGVSSIQTAPPSHPSAPVVTKTAQSPMLVDIPRRDEVQPNKASQGCLVELPKTAPQKPTQDASESILARMQPGQEYSRAQLCDALGLSVYEWNMAIRDLKDSGRVVQTGEKRGARYRLR